MKSIIFLIAILTSFFTNAVYADSKVGPVIPSCPEADQGFQRNCLYLTENSNNPESRKIRLFYQWYNHFDPLKESIVFLNGGPGASMDCYLQDEVILGLYPKYNVLFYDQRGIGRSSAVTNLENVDLDYYHTQNNIEDIERLRKEVIGQDRIIVMGHSYGAHLAFGYGVQYPDRVLKIVALNGSADYMGFLTQPYLKATLLEKTLNSLDNQNQLQVLFQLLQQGKAINSRGETIQFVDLIVSTMILVSTYKGQMEGIAKEFSELLEYNKEKIKVFSELLEHNEVINDEIFSPQINHQVPISEPDRYTSVLNQGINSIINPFISCNDLMPKAGLKNLPDMMKHSVIQSINVICSNTQNDDNFQNVFDVKEELSNIQVPTLIVGGTHDPLIDLNFQKRDYKLLSDSNPQTTLLIMEDVGHQIYENPKCLARHIEQFLDNSLPFETINCLP